MYVVTDKRRLTSEFVRGEDMYQKLSEEAYAMGAKSRLHDQEEMKNEELKAGNRMHSSELIARIHRIAPHIQVRKGAFEGFLTLWVPTSEAEYQNDERRGHKYIQAAFQQGWLPEFTFVRVDDQDQIKTAQDGGVQEGWRYVLLRLLQHKVVTWKQVVAEFGDATGINAKRWQQTTTAYRI